MAYPREVASHEVPDQLPSDCTDDFKEARLIANESPRGAAAILRLVLERIVKGLLGVPDSRDKLDALIGQLTEREKFPRHVVKAMHAVRMYGGESVHAGRLDVHDDPAAVTGLFKLINIIVQRCIVEPSVSHALYENLTPDQRQRIEERGDLEAGAGG